jgi:putative transposase
MARKLRIQYPGAIYHVMNRGDHQERVFVDDEDRHMFLATLGEVCQKTGWQVHGFCLMSNHFHLVVETPSANLVEGMKWLLGVYTRRFNRRQKVFGHLFSGRYKALVVDGSGNGYLKTVCDYVHLNPLRAGLLGPEQALNEYRWSSYPLYTADQGPRPGWLRVDRLFGEWRIPWDVPGAGAKFAAVMKARRQGELEREFKPVERGWCVGSKEFRAEMLKYIEEQRGKWHYGAELWESAQAKAEHLIAEALKSQDISEQELARWTKGHPFKVQVAAQLRAETTVTLEWIAQRLGMGSRGHLAQLLQKRNRPPAPTPAQPMLNL